MKRLLIGIVLVMGAHLANAQYYKTDTTRKPPPERREGGFDRSRLMVGGSVGAVIGDYTNINLSPMIGYRFSDYFAAGVTINAQYGSERFRTINNLTTQRNQYTIFGGGLYGRVYPIQELFIHVQPEYNLITQKVTLYDPKSTYKSSYGTPSLLIGGGYSQPVSDRAAISLMVLYDILQDKNSPYQNRPVFRGGVNIGI
ncbi:hypothetical protein [Chitinophaga defluvii]|uniref:Outer membrane protein with beta-barrel domain n=1 Tax=Chitinophaga defluvii TaxID=3163343 RepID=A0ABV2TE02_9BACT